MSQSLIHRRFEKWAAERPNAVAVETAIDRLTYGELDHRANQIARALLASGVKPDVPVGLVAERSIEGVVATVGIMKSGGACCPIELEKAQDAICPLFDERRLPIILSQRHLITRLGPIAGTVICLDIERISACASAPAVAVTGDNLAYVVPTADSNGVPAGIEIVHHSICRLIGDGVAVKFTADDVLPLTESLTSSSTILGIWGALLHGGRVAIAPPTALSLREFGCFLRRRLVTAIGLSADQTKSLVDECLDDLGSLRKLIVVGSLPASQIAKLRTRYPKLELIGGYSPIDALPPTCFCRIDEKSEPALLPAGRPVSGVCIAVLDEQRQAAESHSGELCIGGHVLPRGYRNRPDLNLERFIPHPFEPGVRLFRTGDRVRLRDDGVIEFLGRIDAAPGARNIGSDHAAVEAA